MPTTDGDLTPAEEQALSLFTAHINNCPQCERHRGHIPIGLCVIGLELFMGLNHADK